MFVISQEYIPLAMLIADDYYLTYSSRDVQLLIACCIADVLRVYAPEAPYKDSQQVKVRGFLLSATGNYLSLAQNFSCTACL